MRTYTFDTQGVREIEIFKKFVHLIKLDVNEQTIAKQNPPSPDIYCRLKNGQEIEFELVEIIDQGMARNTKLQLDFPHMVERELAFLKPEKKSKIKSKFANQFIAVHFNENRSKSQVQQAIKTIINFLLNEVNIEQGSYSPKNYSFLDKNIKVINIKKIDIEGPIFYLQVGGSYTEDVVPKISNKFSKKYSKKNHYCPINYE